MTLVVVIAVNTRVCLLRVQGWWRGREKIRSLISFLVGSVTKDLSCRLRGAVLFLFCGGVIEIRLVLSRALCATIIKPYL